MAKIPAPTALDLTMHHMAQTNPGIDQIIGIVLRVRGAAPELMELRNHITNALPHLPRLTHYLQGPGIHARWVHDPDPNLHQRILQRRLTPDDVVESIVRELRTHPLPSEGPRWDLWLLHGYTDDEYILCHRAHHSLQDGGGMRHTLATLFGASQVPSPPAAPPRPGFRAFRDALRCMLSAFATSHIWDDPAHPLTGKRNSCWVQVPTEDLRAAAARHKGSANDAYLAALAGALRTWGERHWPRGQNVPFPALMMVDLRAAGEEARPGNMFTFAPVMLPAQHRVADERLRNVMQYTSGPKNAAQRQAMRILLDHTPAMIFQVLATRFTSPSGALIDTAYVPWKPMNYKGAPVIELRGFTWLPQNHPVSVTACSYNGVTTVYFVTDSAVPGLDNLPQFWRDALAELASPKA